MAECCYCSGLFRSTNRTAALLRSCYGTGGFLCGLPTTPGVSFRIDCRLADFGSASGTDNRRISRLGTGSLYCLLLSRYIMAERCYRPGFFRSANSAAAFLWACRSAGGFFCGLPTAPWMGFFCNCWLADFGTASGAYDCCIALFCARWIYSLLLSRYIVSKCSYGTCFLCPAIITFPLLGSCRSTGRIFGLCPTAPGMAGSGNRWSFLCPAVITFPLLGSIRGTGRTFCSTPTGPGMTGSGNWWRFRLSTSGTFPLFGSIRGTGRTFCSTPAGPGMSLGGNRWTAYLSSTGIAYNCRITWWSTCSVHRLLLPWNTMTLGRNGLRFYQIVTGFTTVFSCSRFCACRLLCNHSFLLTMIITSCRSLFHLQKRTQHDDTQQ